MDEKEIEKRAAVVAEQFAGCQVMEAVDVLGNALLIASKKDSTHAVIPIYYIGKLIEEVHGRSALVKIKDDGDLSFTLAANGVKQEIF